MQLRKIPHQTEIRWGPQRALQLTLVCLFALMLASAWQYIRNNYGAGVLVRGDQIASLKAKHAGSRARFRAVVTYYDFEARELYAQDSTGAIRIRRFDRDWNLHLGDLIEVQANTTADSGNAMASGDAGLANVAIEVVGRAAQPNPLPASATNLPPSGMASARIELHGIVRTAEKKDGHLLLDFALKEEGHLVEDSTEGKSVHFPVFVLQAADADPHTLVDADVAIRGVAGEAPPGVDPTMPAIELLVPDAEDVRVEGAPPSDPVRMASLRALFLARPLVATGHRVEVRGEVVSRNVRDHIFVIADESGALPIEGDAANHVKPGEYIEVTGFPVHFRYTVVLQDPTFRNIEAGPSVAATTKAQREPAKPQTNLPTMTTIQEIRKLSPEQAELRYPVRVEGTITYHDPDWHEFFLQDSTAGIYLDDEDQGDDLQAGQRVLVEGVTGPGGFAPVIIQPHTQVLGAGRLPEPRQLSPADAVSGNKDSQWVEMEGIVHPMSTDEIGHVAFELYTSLGPVNVHTPLFQSAFQPEHMIDAKVRVRGVFGTRFNNARQLVGLAFYLPNLSDVKILEPAPPDPFSVPAIPISDLLQFSPRGNANRQQRVRGVVTMHRAGSADVYIQDATGGLQVRTDNPAQPGDLIDAVGYALPGEYSPVLEDAVIRKVGNGETPSVPAITPQLALDGKFNNQRVVIEGRLLSRAANAREQVLVLQDGGFTFNAELDGAASAPDLSKLREGSIVQLTGICSVQEDRSRRYFSNYDSPGISSFRILLGSPEDIQVVRNAPWWTLETTLTALALTMLAIALVLIWVIMLRRTVQKRTAELVRSEKLAALGRLVASVAHELNNPLTAVVGYAQLLHAEARTDAERERLDKLGHEARRMKHIIENLISFARPRVSERCRSDIGMIVQRALVLFEYNLRIRGIQVTLNFEPGLPRLDLDESQFLQVFLSLFNNSADALDRASERRIWVEGYSEGGRLKVRFADSGPGFPDPDRAFDPFYTTKPIGKGTGLGLSICYGIVKEHHGEIRARNLKPHGAEVIMEFPLAKPAPPKPKASTQAKARAKESSEAVPLLSR